MRGQEENLFPQLTPWFILHGLFGPLSLTFPIIYAGMIWHSPWSSKNNRSPKMMTMFNYTTSYAKSTLHCGLWGQNLEKNIWCEIVSLIDTSSYWFGSLSLTFPIVYIGMIWQQPLSIQEQLKRQNYDYVQLHYKLCLVYTLTVDHEDKIRKRTFPIIYTGMIWQQPLSIQERLKRQNDDYVQWHLRAMLSLHSTVDHEDKSWKEHLMRGQEENLFPQLTPWLILYGLDVDLCR